MKDVSDSHWARASPLAKATAKKLMAAQQVTLEKELQIENEAFNAKRRRLLEPSPPRPVPQQHNPYSTDTWHQPSSEATAAKAARHYDQTATAADNLDRPPGTWER